MKYATGAEKSPLDLRTYSYKPTKVNKKGGVRYLPKDIFDQHRVGICTSISFTTLAHKATGKKYSPDFLYLIQKKYINGNWDEGSSIFSSCKAAHKYGLILEKDFAKYITEEDRKMPYSKYVKKLQAIPDDVIEKLLTKAEKIEAYAKVPVDPDYLSAAVDNSKAGLLVRFVIGNEWWKKPILPLRKPASPISGHAVVHSDYDGDEFWIANSWGSEWAENGSGYSEFSKYKPTEAYAVFFKEIPEEVNKKVTLNQVIKLLKWLKLNKYIK